MFRVGGLPEMTILYYFVVTSIPVDSHRHTGWGGHVELQIGLFVQVFVYTVKYMGVFQRG